MTGVLKERLKKIIPRVIKVDFILAEWATIENRFNLIMNGKTSWY